MRAVAVGAVFIFGTVLAAALAETTTSPASAGAATSATHLPRPPQPLTSCPGKLDGTTQVRLARVYEVSCERGSSVMVRAFRDDAPSDWQCDGHGGKWLDFRYFIRLACWDEVGGYVDGVGYRWPRSLLPLGKRVTVAANRNGVLRLGGLRPRKDASRDAVDKAFGSPARERERRFRACLLRWPDLGLTIYMANFGAGDRCHDGAVQRAVIAGDRGRERWATKRGLRVGDRLSRLRKLYPNAERHRGRWWLQPGLFLGHYRLAIIAATVKKGRVHGLRIWIGGAGD